MPSVCHPRGLPGSTCTSRYPLRLEELRTRHFTITGSHEELSSLPPAFLLLAIATFSSASCLSFMHDVSRLTLSEAIE